MILIAALSLSLWSHLPALPRWGHRAAASAAAGVKLPARVGPWRIDGRWDRFAGTRACAISAPGVGFYRGVLLFRIGSRGDTRAALFRVDGGPARPVTEAFDTVEGLGVFPRRGWIVDPQGGEVVLPLAYASGARTIAIRAAAGQRPRRFRVSGLDQAITLARAAGCSTSPG